MRDLMYPPITFDRFCALRDDRLPKRICFGSTHKTALKRSNSGAAVGFLNVPFAESIGGILPWPLFANKGRFGGCYRAIHSEEEYSQIADWIGRRTDLVFIRSLFKTALACCEHYTDDGRSAVGELERAAKYDADGAARRSCADILERVFAQNLAGSGIQAVASVPSSNPAARSLPNYLARELAHRTNLPDLSAAVRWRGPKGKIKELGVAEKWQALEKAGLEIDDVVASKNILIIDDMYQSGATAHFVGSKLREASANDLHILCVSKGKRDTDNQ
jgi:predicted amidophosphoribosyltransferase